MTTYEKIKFVDEKISALEDQHLYISFNDDETEIMYLAIEFKKK